MSRRSCLRTAATGIPEATIARLPVYLRALYAFAEQDIATVSSEELAAAAGVNSAKLRKDLSHLGSYGTRGVGYDVEYLVYQVSRELGLTQDWPVVIVGAGNLGRALANYGGFASRGFRIAAVLDCRPAVVGTEIAGPGVPARRRDRGRGRPARRVDRRDRHPGRRPPRRSATGWSRPGSPASSTSRRSCSACRRVWTCVRSTCRSSCRSWPSTRSGRSVVRVTREGCTRRWSARMSVLVVGLSHKSAPVAHAGAGRGQR